MITNIAQLKTEYEAILSELKYDGCDYKIITNTKKENAGAASITMSASIGEAKFSGTLYIIEKDIFRDGNVTGQTFAVLFTDNVTHGVIFNRIGRGLDCVDRAKKYITKYFTMNLDRVTNPRQKPNKE